MTPEERAVDALNRIGTDCERADIEIVAAAIRDAVEAERVACESIIVRLMSRVDGGLETETECLMRAREAIRARKA